MKKLIINLSLLLLTVTGFCQTQKGSWLVGANIGSGAYSSEEAKSTNSLNTTEYNYDYHTFTIGILPYGLYFIQDNLAIGATVGINYNTNKDESGNTNSPLLSTSKYHTTTLSFDPEIRKYFGTAGSKMQPWVNIFGGVNTAPGKQTNSTSNSTVTTTFDGHSFGWNAGAGVGFSYFINSHIGIQYYVNYKHSYAKEKYDVKYSTGGGYNYTNKYTYNDINFGVGLQIHLARKGK